MYGAYDENNVGDENDVADDSSSLFDIDMEMVIALLYLNNIFNYLFKG